MFDVVVVGGGPAGLSAALMLGRCRRTVLVCDSGRPRNARSQGLHGYLTRDGVTPGEFTALGRAELERYGVAFVSIEVLAATGEAGRFRITFSDGRQEAGRFLLLATGVTDELPAVPGLDACYGRSVFHCPYCDGWEWRDRRLGALGSGRSGSGLALSLKAWSADVLLCTNGGRLESQLRERLERNQIRLRVEPIDWLDHEQGLMTSIMFRSGKPEPRDALFFSSGQHPQCDLAVTLGCGFNRRGTVNTGTLSNTNVPGVFVAGDLSRDAQFVVVAAAEGVKAAMAINRALQREDLQP
jgi:thioredoxin reductase